MPNRTIVPVPPQRQDDLARVEIAVVADGEDADIDLVAVVGLDGDGHVIRVDEQAVVGVRQIIRLDRLALRSVIRGGKLGEQFRRIGNNEVSRVIARRSHRLKVN